MFIVTRTEPVLVTYRTITQCPARLYDRVLLGTEPVLVTYRTITLSHQVLILLLACATTETMCGWELEKESKELGKRLVDLLRDTPTTSIILNDEELLILRTWVDAGCGLTTGNRETHDTLVSIKEYLNNLPEA